jgi:hypothetical protein
MSRNAHVVITIVTSPQKPSSCEQGPRVPSSLPLILLFPLRPLFFLPPKMLLGNSSFSHYPTGRSPRRFPVLPSVHPGALEINVVLQIGRLGNMRAKAHPTCNEHYRCAPRSRCRRHRRHAAPSTLPPRPASRTSSEKPRSTPPTPMKTPKTTLSRIPRPSTLPSTRIRGERHARTAAVVAIACWPRLSSTTHADLISMVQFGDLEIRGRCCCVVFGLRYRVSSRIAAGLLTEITNKEIATLLFCSCRACGDVCASRAPIISEGAGRRARRGHDGLAPRLYGRM